MSEITPPIPLDNLPETTAVWNALVEIQQPLRAMSVLVRATGTAQRLEVVCVPDAPDLGHQLVDRAREKMSAHQALHYHANLQAFDASWMTLCNALKNHSGNHPLHQLKLRSNQKAKFAGGEHMFQEAWWKWKPGKAPVLSPLLEKMAQYERLGRITPKKPQKSYSFIHLKRQSAHYNYVRGVDAADAALRCLIETRQPFFHGANHHANSSSAYSLPVKGTAPKGEEDWKEVAMQRAKQANIDLRID